MEFVSPSQGIPTNSALLTPNFSLYYSMRFLLVIFISLLVYPPGAQAQSLAEQLETRYTIEIAPTSLIEVLGIIRAQTDVRFAYSPSGLPRDQLIEVSESDTPLRQILDVIFEPLYIEYEIIGNQLVLRWIPPSQRPAFTQTIRGRILDRDSQTPLIGANVVVTSMNPIRGASTDENGFFSIPGLPLGRHTLIAQYIGFDAAKIPELLLTAAKK